MIDLHSHILPSIDDGAQTISDTLAIAQNTVDNGVTHMMCTPHINYGTFNNSPSTIEPAFKQAVEAIQNANIPLKIAMACEMRICPEVITLVKQTNLPFIGQWKNRSAVLLELPHSHIPPGAENLIRWLVQNNIQPVIPHPERNRDILANYAKAKWLKQQGCLFQVTAGAFVNRFSDKVMKTVWQLLNDELIDYVASDTHNVTRRPNDMLAAYKAVEQKHGRAVAQQLFVEVPQQITADVQWQ
ncbi:tyrosine-protein phosphatase [Glaciecola sp. 2405UD65-10]|uniref:tyrosine-protein phosphatase n=1 Tax=Glaciecola sp. 2405UD65-10 TaxID=3397244 RepID=UPI003B5ACCEE